MANLDINAGRDLFTGPPKNGLSFAKVGHYDATPQFCRIENSQLFIEVTLVPSGEEVVARGMVGNGQAWSGIQFGERVIVCNPAGDGDDWVVLGKLSDTSWPLPDAVSGVPVAAPAGPSWFFLRTDDGELIAIESGDGADITVHSGGSVRIGVNPGEQILLSGRTHIGADFTTPPVGASCGPDGELIPGAPGGPYVPPPYVLTPGAPLPLPAFTGPADGLLRAKDSLQSDITVDPAFWAWITAVHALPTVGAILAALPTPVPVPTALTSTAKTASRSTAAD